MPRKGKSAVKKAGGVIARAARTLTAKINPKKRAAAKAAAAPVANTARKPKVQEGGIARPKRVKTDVAMDLIAESYTPRQTSLKASFRSDGNDQQSDQEMPIGGADRWQDEDHFTNKSGDARIGTHGRSYEPGEAKKEKRR